MMNESEVMFSDINLMDKVRIILDITVDGYDWYFFFFQAEDGIRDIGVTGVQTCALPIYSDSFICKFVCYNGPDRFTYLHDFLSLSGLLCFDAVNNSSLILCSE